MSLTSQVQCRAALIEVFDTKQSETEIEATKKAITESNLLTSSRLLSSTASPRGIREQPGGMALPPIAILLDLFELLPKGATRLAGMTLFEVGMRIEELETNTLLPGRQHLRCEDKKERHSSWPGDFYELAYSLTDYKMLGVLPPAELAIAGMPCSYKIFGKGRKIRLSYIPSQLLLSHWQYANGARKAFLRKKGITTEPAPIFLNRYGDPLSAHAIWEAFGVANERMKLANKITPHVLRHAFACNFLEVGIKANAQKAHFDPENLTLEQMEAFGSPVLLTLQDILGHTFAATTAKYLKQLTSGKFGLHYSKAWNDALDDYRGLGNEA